MSTATIQIPKEKKDDLEVIAGIEGKEVGEIISGLIDEYIQRHIETSELLSRPEWVEIIRKGKKEVTNGLKGKTLDELED
ncbi:MAG: hypothetical protein SFH39_08805 [Candidatus Magnetobacterium sp. LHC-1]|nr:hypothetical protein [Nitrospirota bacterium]